MPPFIRENRIVSTGLTVITALLALLALPESVGDTFDRIESAIDVLWTNPLAGLAILLAITLAILINWDLIEAHLLGKKKERWPTDVELEADLSRWLRASSFTLQDMPVEDRALNPGVKLAFGFVATDRFKRPVYVIKMDAVPAIQLQVLVRASEEQDHKAIIESMTASQRAELLEDIGIELARAGVSFLVKDLVGDGVTMMNAIIVSDSLTPGEFVSEVILMTRLTLVLQMLTTRHVRLASDGKVITTLPVDPILLEGKG